MERSPKTLEGARTAATPAEAAKTLKCMDVRCRYKGRGKRAVRQGRRGSVLRPGVTVIDSSTIAPQATLDFAARVRAKGRSLWMLR